MILSSSQTGSFYTCLSLNRNITSFPRKQFGLLWPPACFHRPIALREDRTCVCLHSLFHIFACYPQRFLLTLTFAFFFRLKDPEDVLKGIAHLKFQFHSFAFPFEFHRYSVSSPIQWKHMAATYYNLKRPRDEKHNVSPYYCFYMFEYTATIGFHCFGIR